ncbi:polysaccharide deacetylase family protein [Parahaliea aestuarii]|uniref:Polysaccharide deacetylase family protein n=1 Tax=Parahaliea aestuarii TaxID=1852021 RepID=A0A5C8ZPE6_9GAMM|nr:polysaccharide deacetylase family protein [Parahaliea aestuarii]TXS89644.1 polysaccharide deacetylase family protein [Parahaliea aestuarii]
MKHGLLWIARALGLFALCSWLTRRELRILCYHGIWDGPGHYGNYLFMSPGKFRSRLAFLQDWGARVLPLPVALERLAQGRLPARAVVITIDDGWASTVAHMVPALEQAGFPATLYVTSYYAHNQRPVLNVALAYALSRWAAGERDSTLLPLPGLGQLNCPAGDAIALHRATDQVIEHASTLADDDARQAFLCSVISATGLAQDPVWGGPAFRLASRDQLREASAKGIDLQLHTHRHRTTCNGTSCLAQELADNRSWLTGVGEGPFEHFCYPSGQYQASDWEVLRRQGIESATTTEIGLCRRGENPYALPRILDGESLSELELEAELSGFLTMLRRISRR